MYPVYVIYRLSLHLVESNGKGPSPQRMTRFGLSSQLCCCMTLGNFFVPQFPSL